LYAAETVTALDATPANGEGAGPFPGVVGEAGVVPVVVVVVGGVVVVVGWVVVVVVPPFPTTIVPVMYGCRSQWNV
jgi:hypothetical protein